MGELAAPVDPWPGAPIIIDSRYGRAMRLIERGSIMNNPTPAVPAASRKRRIWPFLLVGPLALLLCGGALTLVAAAMGAGGGAELRPGRSAVDVLPTPTPDPATAAEPVGDPAWQLSAGDLELKVKTRDKDCFGSAGCTVEYRIDAGVTDDVRAKLLRGERSYDVTYEVRGLEGGTQVGTMTVQPDGTFLQDGYQGGLIPSSSTKLRAKVVEVAAL